MTRLDFLSPSRCAPEALASPLRRALPHPPDTVSDTAPRNDAGSRAVGVRHRIVGDLSLEGKVELRGDLDRVEPQPGEELVRLSPRRGLLLTDDPLAAVERARAAGVLAYDVSGGLAGLALEGERLLRRLTDLDLERLPAAGPFAHVAAILLRDEGERFRVYLPQELAHDVAEAVLDTLAGLEEQGDA